MFLLGMATVVYFLGGSFVGFLSVLGGLPWYQALFTTVLWPVVVPGLWLYGRFR